jgi:hypothetical protein
MVLQSINQTICRPARDEKPISPIPNPPLRINRTPPPPMRTCDREQQDILGREGRIRGDARGPEDEGCLGSGSELDPGRRSVRTVSSKSSPEGCGRLSGPPRRSLRHGGREVVLWSGSRRTSPSVRWGRRDETGRSQRPLEKSLRSRSRLDFSSFVGFTGSASAGFTRGPVGALRCGTAHVATIRSGPAGNFFSVISFSYLNKGQSSCHYFREKNPLLAVPIPLFELVNTIRFEPGQLLEDC